VLCRKRRRNGGKMENKDVRWVQRFDNFSKACALLSEINAYDPSDTPAIVCGGFIQRFEITFDLAWKTAKDYLENLGHSVQPSPRPIIKEAFSVGVISEGQTFIDMLESRNLLSHSYDEETFHSVFSKIKKDYYPAIEKLRAYLEDRVQ
jgi:nucleotidyltransferase substrate binding protein (TIGR01987 family)